MDIINLLHNLNIQLAGQYYTKTNNTKMKITKKINMLENLVMLDTYPIYPNISNISNISNICIDELNYYTYNDKIDKYSKRIDVMMGSMIHKYLEKLNIHLIIKNVPEYGINNNDQPELITPEIICNTLEKFIGEGKIMKVIKMVNNGFQNSMLSDYLVMLLDITDGMKVSEYLDGNIIGNNMINVSLITTAKLETGTGIDYSIQNDEINPYPDIFPDIQSSIASGNVKWHWRMFNGLTMIISWFSGKIKFW
jgi:hypothetical protein